MSEEFEPATLSDGTSVVVRPSHPGYGTITVEHRRADVVLSQLAFRSPNAGLGGGCVILSPSEQLALVSLSSGQSEEGYELFDLTGGLRKVAGEPYRFGEAASFAFSSDEAQVVMALPFTCSEWWLPWDDGEVEPDGDDRLAFDFGQLRFQEIATGRLHVSTLRVSASRTWSPERAGYDPDMRPRFLASGRLAFSMPWGDVDTGLPAPATIVLPLDA
jgi:hypothetical protein